MGSAEIGRELGDADGPLHGALATGVTSATGLLGLAAVLSLLAETMAVTRPRSRHPELRAWGLCPSLGGCPSYLMVLGSQTQLARMVRTRDEIT
jgi:hypothetical protein